jgi:hypothetical protein
MTTTTINTTATTRFLQAIKKYEPLTIAAEDTLKYLGLTSRNGMIALGKRLEAIGLITITRNRPMPNTYSMSKDSEVLEKYQYLLKPKVVLSLGDIQ